MSFRGFFKKTTDPKQAIDPEVYKQRLQKRLDNLNKSKTAIGRHRNYRRLLSELRKNNNKNPEILNNLDYKNIKSSTARFLLKKGSTASAKNVDSLMGIIKHCKCSRPSEDDAYRRELYYKQYSKILKNFTAIAKNTKGEYSKETQEVFGNIIEGLKEQENRKYIHQGKRMLKEHPEHISDISIKAIESARQKYQTPDQIKQFDKAIKEIVSNKQILKSLVLMDRTSEVTSPLKSKTEKTEKRAYSYIPKAKTDFKKKDQSQNQPKKPESKPDKSPRKHMR